MSVPVNNFDRAGRASPDLQCRKPFFRIIFHPEMFRRDFARLCGQALPGEFFERTKNFRFKTF